MAVPEPFYQEANVVLVGSFNPTIFHPSWFSKHELLPKVETEEIESKGVEIIHPNLAKFELDWLSIQVIPERFIAMTTDLAHHDPLRDLVVSTFEILKHTPIRQLGMNRLMEFSFGEEAIWHKVGDTLAPKKIWEKSLPKRVGLTVLSVQSPRTDDLQGTINVTVQPSHPTRAKHGLSIFVNSHVELTQIESPDVPGILSKYWVGAMSQALNIAKVTLQEVIENGNG